MKKLIFSVITILLLLPSFVKADGGILPPPNHYIYETGQKAAIVYQDKTETLVLSTSFQGDAKDFAYIVPTPTQPQVSKITNDIFTNLESLTMPVYPTGPVPMMGGFGTTGVAEKSDVTIVEEKKVGMFEVKILSATDADALYVWLGENNFIYPADKKYILDDYIQNKWFFTTAKISQDALGGDVQEKIYRGDLTALKFVFQAENMVFPFKISSVIDKNTLPKTLNEPIDSPKPISGSAEIAPPPPDYVPDYGMPITLYILADHKKMINNFNIEYANWISADEIAKLAKDDNGNPWITTKNKMYLTKLNLYLNYSEMDKDLFPDNAPNNEKVGVPSFWEKYSQYILLFGILLFCLFFVLAYWQFTKQKKIVYTICWIIQIISFVLTGLPLTLLFLYAALSPMFYNSGEFLIMPVLFAMPFTMISMIVGEFRTQKSYQLDK